MPMTLYEFLTHLKTLLSPLVVDERYVLADSAPSLGYDGRGRGVASVTFINLPYARVRERRGGSAEAMNNRQLFFVRGFNSGEGLSSIPVDKVQVEQLVGDVRGPDGQRPERFRKKTGTPEKVAAYLAAYVNKTAETCPPLYTHE